MNKEQLPEDRDDVFREFSEPTKKSVAPQTGAGFKESAGETFSDAPKTGAGSEESAGNAVSDSPQTGSGSKESAGKAVSDAPQGGAGLPAGVTGTGAASPRKKNLTRTICSVILALVILAAGFTAGWLGRYYSIDPRLRELGWMLDLLESEHYRDVDMDAVYDDLYDVAMPDIFSSYYTPEEYARLIAESQGHNEGAGIVLAQSGGDVFVWSVVENSPAQQAGLRAGMYILGCGTVGGEVMTGSSSEIISFLRAQEGEFVLYASFDGSAAADASTAHTLSLASYSAAYVVYRDSETSYAFRGASASLTETNDPLTGLDADTAYIRLDAFDGNCAAEFKACLDVMKDRGRGNLIIDLRGNGGGYLTDFQSIASHLLRNATSQTPLVAYAQFRDGTRQNYYAAGNDFSSYFGQDAKISVLADENSASASECLIGALIDYGTISYSDLYLRKDEGAEHYSTYGKGVMQNTFLSPSGGAFQLTVARIYWPNGNCIHERGVTDEDGAVGIAAPFIRDENDTFLQQALAKICKAD